jgi:hypothetical protein
MVLKLPTILPSCLHLMRTCHMCMTWFKCGRQLKRQSLLRMQRGAYTICLTNSIRANIEMAQWRQPRSKPLAVTTCTTTAMKQWSNALYQGSYGSKRRRTSLHLPSGKSSTSWTMYSRLPQISGFSLLLLMMAARCAAASSGAHTMRMSGQQLLEGACPVRGPAKVQVMLLRCCHQHA